MNRILITGIVTMAISVIIMLVGAVYLKPLATIPYVMVIGGLCLLIIGLELVLIAPNSSASFADEKSEGK